MKPREAELWVIVASFLSLLFFERTLYGKNLRNVKSTHILSSLQCCLQSSQVPPHSPAQSLLKYLPKEHSPAQSPARSLQNDTNEGLTQGLKTRTVFIWQTLCVTEYCIRHFHGNYCKAIEYNSETATHVKGTTTV